MSRVIRLPDSIIDEVYEFLEEKGAGGRGLSISQAIQRCISIAIYGTPYIRDGREAVGRLLDPVDPLLKAHVSKWAQTADWDGSRRAPLIPQDVREKLLETAKELNSPVQVEDKVFRDKPLEQKIEPKRSETPPWQDLKRIPLKELKKVYKNHPVIAWCEGDELKTIAVECAFAVLPQASRRSRKVSEVAEDLYEKFIKWQREKTLL